MERHSLPTSPPDPPRRGRDPSAPSVPPRPLTALPSGPLLRVAASGKEPTTAAPLGALVLQPGPPGPGCGAAAAPRAPGPPVPPPGLRCTCCGAGLPCEQRRLPRSVLPQLRITPRCPRSSPPHAPALPLAPTSGERLGCSPAPCTAPLPGRRAAPGTGQVPCARLWRAGPDHPHQSAPVKLLFGSSPWPWAEIPSPDPGSSKPRPAAKLIKHQLNVVIAISRPRPSLNISANYPVGCVCVWFGWMCI